MTDLSIKNKTFCDRELETLLYEVEPRENMYIHVYNSRMSELMNGLHYITELSQSVGQQSINNSLLE